VCKSNRIEFTLWHYTTIDTAATTTGATYFDAAAPYVRVGDVMVCNTDTGGTPGAALHRVAANSNGAVSVAAM